ncbi:MAG: hypothetical protein GC160_22295 [Acidobacteria bacterium]|nr:hypothetical protein [Acidobacteriota bacterium]
MASAASAASGRLFVFYGDRGSIEVRNPADGSLITTLTAPGGAFQAVALPGQGDSQGVSKIYVVSPSEATIFNGRYERVGAIAFSSLIPAAPGAAALSPDGTRLVAAGRQSVTVIDTTQDRVLSVLEPGFPVAGVAFSRDGRTAYVFGAAAAVARAIDLGTAALSPRILTMPARMEAWALSPNGARALSVAEQGLYDPEVFDTEAFQVESGAALRSLAGANPWLVSASTQGASSPGRALQGVPGATPQTGLAVTDSGRYFLYREGTLETGRLNQGEAVRAIAGADAAGLWAVSRDGAALYAAGGQELRATDTETGAEVYTAALTDEATALALVDPVVRQVGSLTLVTPNNQVIAGETRFQIVVKAADGDAGQSNIPVFVSNVFPTSPTVSCLPGVTGSDGQATLDCTLGAVTSARAIQVTISDAAGRTAPIFSLSAVVPTSFEGLAKIDGDGASVPTGDQFSVTVQASRNRLPAANVPLTVTLTPDDPNPNNRLADCPRTVTTGADGMATMTCTAADLLVRTTLEIDFTDPLGNNVRFAVSIDPTAVRPTGLSKVAGDNQTVGQGQPFSVEVVSYRDGAPRAKTTLNISTSPQSQPVLITCPTNAITNNEGHAVINCKAGSIFGQTAKATIQVSDFGVTLPKPFTINIAQFVAGNASTIELVSPEFTSGPPGVELIGFLKVRAVSGIGGMAVPGETVYFSSDGPITFKPAVVETDSQGEAETTVVLGCSLLSFAVNVGLRAGEQLADFDVTVEPGPFAKLTKIRGDNQSGAPGQPLNANALVAVASDACDKAISGQQVSYSVRPPYAASLRNIINISDGSGRVSALATLGNYGGPLEVVVQSGDVSATFDLAVNLPATELRLRSGDAQAVPVGQATPQPLVVQALGTTGFGVGGVPVQWEVVSGPGQITGSTSSTDNVGISYARVRVTGAGLEQEGVEQGAGPLVQVRAIAVGQTVVFALNGGSQNPQATAAGFVNGASFASGWTPGGAGSIFGDLLADSADPVAASVAPFPTDLAGVKVSVNGTPAPLIFVSRQQINLQVPFGTANGAATVEIDNNGKKAVIQNVPINSVQPGVFEITVGGQRIAAALRQDYSVITPTNRPVPGEVVQMYFTGGGPLSPSVATNTPGPSSPLPYTTAGATVKLDGVEQQNLGSFYAPGLITANQINFVVAQGTSAGDHVLVLTMGGADSQQVTLPVAAAP